MSNPTPAPCKTALLDRLDAVKGRRLRQLFDDEPDRAQRLCFEAERFVLDISRQRLSRSDLEALLEVATEARIAQRRDDMFAGHEVNATEKRRAWHVALRQPSAAGQTPEVAQCRQRMASFASAVREGRWLGSDGQSITDVVNVGIGGSHLGPQLACEALADVGQGAPRLHFLSNIDPAAWHPLSLTLDPRRTLLIIASKSWKTQETARNMQAAVRWLNEAGVSAEHLSRHLAAVTAAPDLARASGISDETLFPFWDWVGGRYSLWSAIGLPVMISIGADRFDEMLAGAHAMDRHFQQAPLAANLPVLLALVAFWNRLLDPACTEVVAPYCAPLARLPLYLQQLQMESNGKSVDEQGRALPWHTAAVTWGAPGTDSQHSFFQALHQGTQAHPVEFILALPARADPERRDEALLANAIAQAQALMQGRSKAEVITALRQQGLSAAQAADQAAHRVHAGDRPSTTLLIGRLTPRSFGSLIALYEHKTVSLAWLWGINPFDQWGVELGKSMAGPIEAALTRARRGEPVEHLDDPVTEAWIGRLGSLLASQDAGSA